MCAHAQMHAQHSMTSVQHAFSIPVEGTVCPLGGRMALTVSRCS